MQSTLSPNHPLRRLFGGLVEQVFMAELGVCDPAITDYLGSLLAEFVHIDRIYRMRGVDGRTIRDVSRFHADAYLGPDIPDTARARVINCYIGDFTLFWTGVYPEVLRKSRVTVDRLSEYLVQGKRSYGIASELSKSDEQPPAELLRQLSVQFEVCVHGLRLVRAGWERLGQVSGGN